MRKKDLHPEIIRVTIPSDIKELKKIEHITNHIAKKLNMSEDQEDNLSIAVTEAVGNAIVHGNKKDRDKRVFVSFSLLEKKLRIKVKDEGKGFKPESVTNPLDPENIMKESGRGIFILKSLMDEVKYRFSESGTTLEFTMKLPT